MIAYHIVSLRCGAWLAIGELAQVLDALLEDQSPLHCRRSMQSGSV